MSTTIYTIRRLTERAELEAAFRLRYDVIVKERGLQAAPESHASGMLEDEADALHMSSVFGAFAPDGTLVGTDRAQLLSNGMPEAYAKMFAAAGIVVDDPEHTTVNSRFVFCAEYRRSRLPMALIGHVYRLGQEMGVLRDYIFVEEHIEALYRRLGYTVASEKALVYPGNEASVRALTLDFRAETKFQKVALNLQA